jgi:hypothetical protein
MNSHLTVPARAASLAMFAHHQHDEKNFEHVTAVARRVSADPRANESHVAVAYLQSIGYAARIEHGDMIRAGIPGDVARAVRALETGEAETFLSFLRRVSEHEMTALVAYHNFMEYLSHTNEIDDGDTVRRLRRATVELNEAVDLNTPKSG